MSSISLYSPFRKKKTPSGRVFLRSVYQTPSTDYLVINIHTIRGKKEMTSRSKVKQMKSCEKADARVAVFFSVTSN